MLLAIDVGNTQSHLGIFDGDVLAEHWRFATDAEETADELAVRVSTLLALRGMRPDQVEGSIVSSVVPQLTPEYAGMCERYLQGGCLIVAPGVKTGMPILLDNPTELGADRLVNAVAAYDRFGGACAVADFGTAITFDVVSAEGEYLGGVIGPGVEISMEALARRTAKLPPIELGEPLGEPGGVIGKTTQSSLRSGIVYGFAGAVDAIARRVQRELSDQADFVATGGHAAAIIPFCEMIDEVDDLLTLTGLRLVYERNTLTQPPLTTPFRIGDVTVANRVLLAPLAGIGNWFVRLQARRHGAGLAVSEMVSSFGIHHRNERTMGELLRIHPAEHPVSIQLFGHDPGVMRSAAAIAADAGADLIDLNMGCPVRKVRAAGAGAALLQRPELALRLARAAAEGSGRPVTVKLRSGIDPGDRSGVDLAERLVEEAGVAAVALHPRSAAAQHRGKPDYALVRRLVERLAGAAPVIVSGGLGTADEARRAYRESAANAVMIARGALGNPWIFEQLSGRGSGRPASRAEIVGELLWTMERAEEHLGPRRAARYARKFYPWYLERLGIRGRDADAFQRTESLDQARELLASCDEPLPIAA